MLLQARVAMVSPDTSRLRCRHVLNEVVRYTVQSLQVPSAESIAQLLTQRIPSAVPAPDHEHLSFETADTKAVTNGCIASRDDAKKV